MKLNIGAGTSKLDGFESIDARLGHDATKLNYADGSIDEIYASHILEHFPRAKVRDVLMEWVRVLKPGGRLRLAVPNLRYIAEQYVKGNRNEPLLGYLFGGQTDENDFHYCAFDSDTLRALMLSVGLERVGEWRDSTISDCSSLPVSLNLEGYKSANASTIPRQFYDRIDNVVAVMSCPNVGWIANMRASMRGLAALGIPIKHTHGAYWEQVLTEGILPHLNDGTKYVITLDYDTWFRPEDVIELHRLMEQHPEADAIFPVQMKRECDDGPMFTLPDGNGGMRSSVHTSELEGELIQAFTGHFGLTFLRVEALRKLPHPWFLHKPAPDGTWGNGRIDADIAFWHGFARAGLKVFQANKVCIGHIQPMVTWPSKEWKPVHQYLSRCEESGPPAEVLRK